MSIEDINYYNDSRVRAAEEREDQETHLSFDKHTMTFTFVLTKENDEGDDYVNETWKFPAKFEVCPTCQGKGTHVNPSIDAGGITESEWSDWDYEERETYLSGGYDVDCYGCRGQRVVPEIDTSRLTPQQKVGFELLEAQQRDDADFRACQRAERMMGA
jgi:hypothetical protein